MTTRANNAGRKTGQARAAGSVKAELPAWKLEDAKARFSEVVRMARDHGPQRVTVHGQDAVVVLSASDYARLAPASAGKTLASLFADGAFARLERFEDGVIRERAPVRDAPDFGS